MSSSKGNSPRNKRYKQKLLIGLLIFIIIGCRIIYVHCYQIHRINDLTNSEKYVEFRMPKEKSLTEQEGVIVKNTRVIKYQRSKFINIPITLRISIGSASKNMICIGRLSIKRSGFDSPSLINRLKRGKRMKALGAPCHREKNGYQ